MNRRSFLQTLTAVFVAPLLVAAAPPVTPRLMFHKDAFAFMAADLRMPTTRMDILYGWSTVRPGLVCRVVSG